MTVVQKMIAKFADAFVVGSLGGARAVFVRVEGKAAARGACQRCRQERLSPRRFGEYDVVIAAEQRRSLR